MIAFSDLRRCSALPWVVAYSGGADSTALLLMALEAAPGKVSAVHVHHGLQAAADDFAAHCQAFCEQRGVALSVRRVRAQALAGQSTEDAARQWRYQAIAADVLQGRAQESGSFAAADATDFVASAPTVLLAQHADDQVETMLLALSRGAGVDGLAAMAAQFVRHGVQWARPFLLPAHFMGAQQIRQYLAQRGLSARMPGDARLGQGWVEDPMNQSAALTRNRIRAQVLPALAQVFPQYRETFARSARVMAQCSELLTQEAMRLIDSVGLPPQIGALQNLPRTSQANYLRYWLKTAHQAIGSEAQINELLDQVAACRTRGHQINIRVAQGFVQRDAQGLCFKADSS